MQTHVFPGEADFCLRTVCLRGGGCSDDLAMADSPKLIDSGSVSVVSMVRNLSSACKCPPAGRARHSCSSLPQSPCLNGGTCVDTASGYRCLCAPRFGGPLCQLTLRGFHADGYASFSPIRMCSETHLVVDFVSAEPDGIMLYNGPVAGSPPGIDEYFMLIDIAQGTPRLNIGTLHDAIHLQLPEGVNVTDGKWHRIDVRLKNKEVTLTLDRCSSVIVIENEGVGKSLLSEDRASCEVRGRITQTWRSWNPHHVLQLGGIKSPTPLSHPSFTQSHWKGCLRNLVVNKKVYDLGAPLESVGSTPSCAFCDTGSSTSTPCETPSRCAGEFGAHDCDCHSRAGQHECDKDVMEHFFQPGSFIQYRSHHPLHPQKTHFRTMVRTRQSNSIILSLSSRDQTEYIILQVMSGVLAVSYNIGDGDFLIKLPNHRVDSGEWNEVSLERIQNEFTLSVNGGGEDKEITAAHGTYKEIKVDPNHIILGNGKLQKLGFQGCLKNIRLNNFRLPMENQSSSPVSITRKHGITKGCVSEVCKSHPCSRGFLCTDLWMIHECSCPPGYLLIENTTGQWCMYTVCAQMPCKHGTCIPRSPAEFTCLCEEGYAGSKCDVLLHSLDPGFALSTFLICLCSAALIALIAGAVLCSHCSKKRRLNEGVYHVSAYNDEPKDTQQNVFHYKEEGSGVEDQDAFNMTDLQLSLRRSPGPSLLRTAKETNVNGPFSCHYDTPARETAPSRLTAPRLSCSFTSGDFGQYFYDVCQDAVYMHSSCDSLKVYDTEGAGSSAGSLSTLASSGLESDLEYEDLRAWGPKFGYLSKLYSYTEDDDDAL